MNCLFVYGELIAKQSLEEVRRLQQRAQLTEFTFQLQGENLSWSRQLQIHFLENVGGRFSSGGIDR